MARLIREYFSDDGNRKSVINLDKETLSVDFYENGAYISSREFPNKSIHYVEDAAENWILGILKDASNEE